MRVGLSAPASRKPKVLPIYRVRLPAQTRGEAEKLCGRAQRKRPENLETSDSDCSNSPPAGAVCTGFGAVSFTLSGGWNNFFAAYRP